MHRRAEEGVPPELVVEVHKEDYTPSAQAEQGAAEEDNVDEEREWKPGLYLIIYSDSKGNAQAVRTRQEASNTSKPSVSLPNGSSVSIKRVVRLDGSRTQRGNFVHEHKGTTRTGWITMKSTNVARLPEYFRLAFTVKCVEGLSTQGHVKVKVMGHRDITHGLTLEKVNSADYVPREHMLDVYDYKVKFEVYCEVSASSYRGPGQCELAYILHLRLLLCVDR